MTLRTILPVVLAAVTACGFDEPDTSTTTQAITHNHVFRDVLARPIFRQTITLPNLGPGSTYQISTADLVGLGPWSPDTVINVKAPPAPWPFPSGPTEWMNDNCSSTTAASCVTVAGDRGTYTVTVFARLQFAYGTFDLRVNGVTTVDDAQFGGYLIGISVTPDGPYALQTIHTPNGATNTTLIVLSPSWSIRAIDTSSGIGSAAKIVRTIAPDDYVLVGSASAAAMGTTGLTTFLINGCTDENTDCESALAGRWEGGDADNDWLSDRLELELGTSTVDRDTDDDGILDYYEVIGRRVGTGELELPRFGADPLHADLFVEVDGAIDSGSAPALLDDNIMLPLREIWNDLDFPNPDGTTGVHIHADGGLCTDPTLCWLWGGFNQYTHSCNALPSTATVLANFAPVRRGIFHYTLRGCGAQAYTAIPVTRIGPSNNRDGAEIWSQELGHNLQIAHSGPYSDPVATRLNYKANYPSVMNYAYQNSLGGDPNSHFSHGLMAPLTPEGQSEAAYTPGVDKSFMAGGRYDYDLVGDSIDFDRDGRIWPSPVMYDPAPKGEHGGNWPDVFQLADIGTRVPTGGPGVAVQSIQGSGTTSKVFVAAPFSHGDGVYPEIAWVTHTVGASPGAWSAWHPAPPLPGGGGATTGEVAAAFLWDAGEPTVVVAMPAADGKLYTSFFHATSMAWTPWTAIPSWPAGTRARQATMIQALSSIWVVYRDVNAPDGVPNVHITRRDFDGTWDAWETLANPSNHTPGLAFAADYELYLLGTNTSHGLELWHRPISGGTFAQVTQISWPATGLASAGAVPAAQRTRLQLAFLPFRAQGGTALADGSGYLAAYWNAGTPNTSTTSTNQGDWELRRTYTPGRIETTGSCFGATITGGACGDPATAYVRYQTSTDRPWPAFSPAIAVRWRGATAAYVQSVWDMTSQDGFTPMPRAMAYQPWANGVAYGAPAWYTDNNDADTMREFMCTSLWSLESKECMCDDTCP